MLKKVCRLCGGVQDLLWVFHKQMADNMSEIIHVTSGVQILRTDRVSQMVCSACCKETITMYKFRANSIRNNQELQATYAEHSIIRLMSNRTTNACTSSLGPQSQPCAKISRSKSLESRTLNVSLDRNAVPEWFRKRNLTDGGVVITSSLKKRKPSIDEDNTSMRLTRSQSRMSERMSNYHHDSDDSTSIENQDTDSSYVHKTTREK